MLFCATPEDRRPLQSLSSSISVCSFGASRIFLFCHPVSSLPTLLLSEKTCMSVFSLAKCTALFPRCMITCQKLAPDPGGLSNLPEETSSELPHQLVAHPICQVPLVPQKQHSNQRVYEISLLPRARLALILEAPEQKHVISAKQPIEKDCYRFACTAGRADSGSPAPWPVD